MRPGITVQHVTLPKRRAGLVRCDITGLIGFIHKDDWPEGASSGDYLELLLERSVDFWEHPQRFLFSQVVSRSVGAYFENGGQHMHLFGVCIDSLEDLTVEATMHGVLASLMQRLRVEEDIAILIVPDAAFLPCTVSQLGHASCAAEVLWDTLLSHCMEMGNRFLIMDAPRGLHGDPLIDLVRRFANRSPVSRSFGALYYPWLRRQEQRFPPSGAVAGVFVRSEHQHSPFGVVWPPANISLRSVSGLEVDLDWREAGVLSESRINPLIIQAGRGVVIWGARTLSDDPTWEHINSRRVVSMVSEQLRRDNEWAVFENNDPKTWAVLERNAKIRLEEFWRAGLITSEAPRGDYEVACDNETNPPTEREKGTLNVRVHLRPIGMTEHITIDLRLGESGA
jgi:phage tail sheath protein FI